MISFIVVHCVIIGCVKKQTKSFKSETQNFTISTKDSFELTEVHNVTTTEETVYLKKKFRDTDKSKLINKIEKGWIPPDFTTFKEAIHILSDELHMKRHICKRVSEKIKIKLGSTLTSKVYAAYEENDPAKNIYFIVVTNENIDIHEMQGFPIKSQYKSMSVSEDKMISREEICRKLLISRTKFQDMGKSLKDEKKKYFSISEYFENFLQLSQR
ncbi:uncharacterized protein LOC128233628 [Mya arenaria]|uniref:uncharacterized protein LOC128233628 n=1 Tax=Mya arenaria TaxID=6604 RepID=UPI0022DFC652|nr:uncharacterized protein LOC128233628 [Mya arenaria]XP_052803351.1 uncharacterized protein LOC128233628 [Mya arenaria]